MKFFKRFLVATLLIGILSTSTILCACNPNDCLKKPPSGAPSETEQPSGTPSGNDEIVEPYTLSLTQFYLENQNPYISGYFDDETKLNLAEKINSVEELKSFCKEKHLNVFDETDTSLKYDRVSKKLKECDENFFSKQSIVLIFRFKETTDYYTYDSIDIKDGVMTINLVTENGNTTTDVTTQIRIFEISKEVAEKINQIKVEEKLGELDQMMGIKIYKDENLEYKEDAPMSYIIKSFDEMVKFCDEVTSPFFKKNNLTIQDIFPDLTDEILNDENFIKMFDEMFNNKNKKMIEILNKYDEKFFEDNTLVLVFRPRGSNRFYKLKNLNINGNALNITLSTPRLDNAFPVLEVSTYLYLLEPTKEQVKDVSVINVTEIEE